MKTVVSAVLSFSFLTFTVSAQQNPFFAPLVQVKQFFQLSDPQLRTILMNNDEYNRWSFEKQNRIRQVQTEIAEETTKPALDPNALGIRYAEVESICREMKDRATESRARNLEVLNPDQKAKLKVLDDAIKLAPVISEAQFGNLMGGLNPPQLVFTSNSASIGGTIIGGIIGAAPGCYLPFPVPQIRTGDFAAAVPKGNVMARPTRWFDVQP